MTPTLIFPLCLSSFRPYLQIAVNDKASPYVSGASVLVDLESHAVESASARKEQQQHHVATDITADTTGTGTEVTSETAGLGLTFVRKVDGRNDTDLDSVVDAVDAANAANLARVEASPPATEEMRAVSTFVYIPKVPIRSFATHQKKEAIAYMSRFRDARAARKEQSKEIKRMAHTPAGRLDWKVRMRAKEHRRLRSSVRFEATCRAAMLAESERRRCETDVPRHQHPGVMVDEPMGNTEA